MPYAGLPIAIKLVAMALMWNFPLDAVRQRAIGTIETKAEVRANRGQSKRGRCRTTRMLIAAKLAIVPPLAPFMSHIRRVCADAI
jgi:hypothetical protein